MKAVKIKNLNKGDFFTLKPYEQPADSRVYVRGEYDRSTRAYDAFKFEDVNEYRSYKGDKIVYTDFIF